MIRQIRQGQFAEKEDGKTMGVGRKTQGATIALNCS